MRWKACLPRLIGVPLIEERPAAIGVPVYAHGGRPSGDRRRGCDLSHSNGNKRSQQVAAAC